MTNRLFDNQINLLDYNDIDTKFKNNLFRLLLLFSRKHIYTHFLLLYLYTKRLKIHVIDQFDMNEPLCFEYIVYGYCDIIPDIDLIIQS